VEALELSVTSSRRYQTEKERLYLTALTLTGIDTRSRRNSLPAPAGAWTMKTVSGPEAGFSSGVSQLLKTGGRLSASLANDIVYYFTGNPRTPGR